MICCFPNPVDRKQGDGYRPLSPVCFITIGFTPVVKCFELGQWSEECFGVNELVVTRGIRVYAEVVILYTRNSVTRGIVHVSLVRPIARSWTPTSQVQLLSESRWEDGVQVTKIRCSKPLK
jgi:hypothetical protein